MQQTATRALPAILLGLSCSVPLCIVEAGAQARPEPFQIPFGNRQQPGQGMLADTGLHLVEADNGDIIVGGYADSRSSEGPIFPLLARVDRDGNLLWQQTYHDLRSLQVRALIADESGEYVVLSGRGYTIRKIGDDGTLSLPVARIPLTGGVPMTTYRESGGSTEARSADRRRQCGPQACL